MNKEEARILGLSHGAHGSPPLLYRSNGKVEASGESEGWDELSQDAYIRAYGEGVDAAASKCPRLRMTRGVLPSQETFDSHYSAHVPGKFSFGNDKRVGTCELNASELWAEVSAATEEGEDESLAWASDVLRCLGIEWV